MKNRSSWLILVASFFIYWVSVFIIASVMNSHSPGIEQYFLRVISKGIDLSPLVGIIVVGLVSFINKNWFKSNKVIIIVILAILIFFELFIIFFNHT
jgi:hypothetical protein